MWGCLLGEGRERKRKSRQQDWQREQELFGPLMFPVWAQGRSACLALLVRAKSLQGLQVQDPGALQEESGNPEGRKEDFQTKTGRYAEVYLK